MPSAGNMKTTPSAGTDATDAKRGKTRWNQCKRGNIKTCAKHGKMGTLSRDDDDANQNGTKKLHSRFLNTFVIISTHLVCVIWLNYPGANVVEAALKFRKRKEN